MVSPNPLHDPAAPLTRELASELYEELRSLARLYFRRHPGHHTLQPTALVNEAYLKLCQSGSGGANRWASPTHFFAYAATTMRTILVDHAKRKAAAKRGGNAGFTLDAAMIEDGGSPFDVLELNDAIDRFAGKDERAAKVVVLRFFAGMSIAESAEFLGVSDFTVERDWRMARAWLARELRN